MNTLLFFYKTNLLLPRGVIGIFWSILLFALCFFGVHIAKLAHLGQLYRKNPPPEKDDKPTSPPAEPEKKAPAPAQEPVYYIVERKKKRAKPQYGEPKEIRFK
jgi:hypothetical protein